MVDYKFKNKLLIKLIIVIIYVISLFLIQWLPRNGLTLGPGHLSPLTE